MNWMVEHGFQQNNGMMISAIVNLKTPIKYCIWEEDFTWNLSRCTYECEKDFKINEHLRDHTWMKILVSYVTVTFDKLVDTPCTTPIKSASKNSILSTIVYIL